MADVGGSGSDTRRAEGRGPIAGEEELATKMLHIQSKRFYLDVKQNRRGRFLKIAEVGAGGRKSRLLLSMGAAAEFRDQLSAFADFNATLGPSNPENLPPDGRLKSESLVKENRRYYLDLKENNRGRFLRVTQTVARGGGPRSQIALPAQGIAELRDGLRELLEEFGDVGEESSTGVSSQLPEGRQIRAENKLFYFDVGQNNRGVFLRISECKMIRKSEAFCIDEVNGTDQTFQKLACYYSYELISVKANFRTAITIPERAWPRFREYFAEVCEKMPPQSLAGDAADSGDA